MVRNKLIKILSCISPDYSVKDGEICINKNSKKM